MARRQNNMDRLNYGRNKRGDTLADMESVLDQLEHRLASTAVNGGSRSAFQEINDRLDQLTSPAMSNSAPNQSAGQSNVDFEAALYDLKQDLSSSFQQQFDQQLQVIQRDWLALAKDLRTQNQLGQRDVDLSAITDKLAQIQNTSSQVSPDYVDAKIDSLRHDLENVAREDSLNSLNRRWDSLEDNWNGLSAHLQSSNPNADLGHLSNQLAQIEERLFLLPSNGEISRLLEEIQVIQAHISHNNEQPNFSTQEIEIRLDEISRAIASTPTHQSGSDPRTAEHLYAIDETLRDIAQKLNDGTPQQNVADPKTIDQLYSIDETLRELAQKMNSSGTDNNANSAFDERLNALGERIEATLEGTHQAASRLSDIELALTRFSQPIVKQKDGFELDTSIFTTQLQALSEKIDGAAAQMARSPSLDPQEITAAVDTRLSAFIEEMQQHSSAMTSGNPIDTSTIDARLSEFIEEMRYRTESLAGEPNAVAAAIDERLASFLEELRESKPEISSDPHAVAEALATGFQDITQRLNAGIQLPADDSALQGLATRLDAVTHLLENPVRQDHPNGAAPDMTHFEAQLADLAERVSVGVNSFANLAPRLDGIEKSIETQGNQTIEAARLAAENAIRSALDGFQLDVNHNSDPMVAQLAADVASLQKIAKGSDGRNAKTFTAIHDTLLKIVNRLEAIETHSIAATPALGLATSPEIRAPIHQQETFTAPPIADDYADHNLQMPEPPLAQQPAAYAAQTPKAKLTPLEAARAAAKAAISGEADEYGANPDAHGFNQYIDQAQNNADDFGDPIAPGNTTPDLDSILKKVRDQRAGSGNKNTTKTAPADLLASARKAAKAAASEAETLKAEAETNNELGGSGLSSLFTRAKRPLMLAAIGAIVVIAGIQLSGMLLGGSDDIDFNEPMAIENSEQNGIMPSNGEMPVITTVEPLVIDGTMDDNAAENAIQANDEMPTFEPELPELEATGSDLTNGDIAPTTAPISANIDAPSIDFGTSALKAAVQEGDAKAFFEVANRYAEGRGVSADLTKAAEWYENAAQLGFAPAQFRIGNFLEKGRGIERDLDQAKIWYQMAAEQGNTSALHNLAVLYASGASGTPDHQKAAEWFQKAAEFGVTDSQFNLAILQAKGLGMPKDLVQSYKWFAIASQGGDSEAGRKRDEVATMLTPEALKEAQAFVDLWRAKDINVESNTFSVPEEWRQDTGTTASVDMEKAIRNIQLILNKNGYDAGTADGIMGGKTKSAIRKFQADQGLPANGEVNDALVKALLAKNT